MKCSKCGTENPDNFKFCGQCGESLNSTRHCPQCSTEVPPEAAYCPECGYKLITITAPRESSSLLSSTVIDEAPVHDVMKSNRGDMTNTSSIIPPQMETQSIPQSAASPKDLEYKFIDLGVGIRWAYSNLGTKHSHKSGPPYHNRPRFKNELEGCRLPNQQEWQALIDGCDYELIRDVNAYEFKSKKNGRTLCVKCGTYWINGTGKGIIIDGNGIKFTTDRGDAHIRLVKGRNI